MDRVFGWFIENGSVGKKHRNRFKESRPYYDHYVEVFGDTL